jgi:transcriptional regulator with XRE-family HTH domain
MPVASLVAAPSPGSVGAMLRAWRARRRLSQLEVGLTAGVSARHLSFVETGRSKPSAELLVALADVLDMPLRERNQLLLAAGFAPRYPETHLDAPPMAAMQQAITRVLDAHDPYPASRWTGTGTSSSPTPPPSAWSRWWRRSSRR